MKPKMIVEYTEEQKAALRRITRHIEQAHRLARVAGLTSLHTKMVTATKYRLEVTYLRKEDRTAPPVRIVEAPQKPQVQPLARPTV